MILTTKNKYKLFFITLLLFHLTGCATQQKTLPQSTTKKNEWFAKDKAKHFLLSFFIGAITYSIAREGEAGKDDASVISIFFTSSCGVGKEIDDEFKHNGWSYKDLIWDLLGGGAAVSISNLLD